MIVTNPLFAVTCRVGRSVRPRLLIAAPDAEAADNEAMLHWASDPEYKGEEIAAISISPLDPIFFLDHPERIPRRVYINPPEPGFEPADVAAGA